MIRMVTYPLRGDIVYARRAALSTLLLSLGRTIARVERESNHSPESVFVYLSGDGDWVGQVLVQDPNDPTLADPARGLRLVEVEGGATVRG
ncbi:hypothetical protein [Saccharomonospora viridis]|uniref:hypothetical protein n=1 Tax=Saccharomonospora viridis TaxID=1852 RepID=UPI002409E32C|nr:hypothetical protein [Saccharomonospora viridis]